MHKFKSFMKMALAEAKKAAQRDEVPVGAVIVNKNGIIVAKAGNRTKELTDPTAHAEILSIRKACQKQKSERLVGHDIYVTLQPCQMCLNAIINARIARLYYGASDTSNVAIDHYDTWGGESQTDLPLEIYPNISEDESQKLMKKFFNEKRRKNANLFGQ